MKNSLKKNILHYLDFIIFTLPALFFVVMVSNIPFILNMYYSLFNWDGISRKKTFVGLDNFIKILTVDNAFKSSVLFTFKFTIFFVVIINVLAILIALLLSKNSKLGYILRSFYFVPHIISLVAVSLIWKCILGPGFTYFFEETSINLFGLSWLGSSELAFFTTLIVTVWQNVGFYMIIYVAGFMAIPSDVLEAASVDGASNLTKFFKIQIPLLMPAITISIFTALTYSFKLFDIILVLTKGGPGIATNTIAYNIYSDAFISNKYGLATAKSLVFFVLVLAITLLQLRFFKSKEVNI